MKKKILSLLTAFAMVFGILVAPFTTASAAEGDPSSLTTVKENAANLTEQPDDKYDNTKGAVTNTVTLHKLMLEKKDFAAWNSDEIQNAKNKEDKHVGYDGSQTIFELAKLAGKNELNEVGDVFFAWQVKGQEKDGTGKEQYIKKADDSTDELVKPAVKVNSDTGEITYTYTTNLDEAFGGKTVAKKGIKFDTSKLKGEYIIQEIKSKSTYKTEDGKTIVNQKAVPVEITLPLVAAKGTVKDAHVFPKNTEEKPKIDKNFDSEEQTENKVEEKEIINSTEESKKDLNFKHEEGTGAEQNGRDKARISRKIGDKVPYKVETIIDAGTAYERLIWNDTMTKGLTYNEKSLTIVGEEVTKDETNPNGYKKVEGSTGITFAKGDYTLFEDAAGFRLVMNKSGLDKIKAVTQREENPSTVRITLKYNATINSSAQEDVAEKNDIKLEYGHKPQEDKEPSTVKPKKGKITVTKKWADGAITKDDKDAVATFTLQVQDGDTWKNVESVTKRYKETENGQPDQTAFDHTFEGLEDGKTYRVVERVSGYTPEYQTTNPDGSVTINNVLDKDNPKPLNPSEPEVVVGGKKFVKTTDKNADDVEAADRLKGAEFVVKNAAGEYLFYKSADDQAKTSADLAAAKKAYNDAVNAYNGETKKPGFNEETVSITVDGQAVTGKKAILAKIAELKATFDAKFEAAYKDGEIQYEFRALNQGETLENAADIVRLTSNEQGQFEIRGLAYAKGYKLQETKAPADYAKREDISFDIEEGSYKKGDIKYAQEDTDKTALQVVNKKVTIPQTGGIGSLIFIVAGLAIMGGAFVAYRKSQAVEA